MKILLFDPVGEVKTSEPAKGHKLDTVLGKAVGYVFNHHPSAVNFWKSLERHIEAKLKPSGIYRMDKDNLSTTADLSELKRLIQMTDFALTGVGA